MANEIIASIHPDISRVNDQAAASSQPEKPLFTMDLMQKMQPNADTGTKDIPALTLVDQKGTDNSLHLFDGTPPIAGDHSHSEHIPFTLIPDGKGGLQPEHPGTTEHIPFELKRDGHGVLTPVNPGTMQNI